ncbi:MAG: DUF4115 domain-containing protein [Gammaproteobacteria bacterium]|nr:DUF4115 domain-containing protein [Gammaproteobacteria bacterium]
MTEPTDDVSVQPSANNTNSGPGERLRRERERKALTIHEISQALHTDMRIIDSLENNEFESLGAPIFVKGHLRNYAKLLGLSQDEIVAAYEAIASTEDPQLVTTKSSGPSVDAQASLMWVHGVGWLVLIALLGMLVAWWYYRPTPAGSDTAAPPPVSATEPQQQTPVVDSVPDDVIQEPAEEIITETEDPPAPDGIVESEDSAVEAEVSAQLAEATPAANLSLLTLTFNDDSWLEVYDAEDARLFFDLAEAGNEYRLNGVAPFRVFLGNAPAAAIMIDSDEFDVAPYIRRDNTALLRINTNN